MSDGAMDTPRHVSFAADTAPAAPAIHPDRVAMMPAATATKGKKTLTEKQKRYQKKKVAKQKILRKAKKAAAPKNKPPIAHLSEVQQRQETPLQDVPAPNGTAEQSEVANEETSSKKRKRKADKADGPTEAEAEQALAAAAEQMEGLNENQKEMLKKAKKAMKVAKRAKKAEDTAKGDANGGDQPIASSSRARSRSASPLVPEGTLPAFPTPTGPAAPDPLLLSTQGLPEALKSAALVDETFRIPVRELRARSRKGKEKAEEFLLDEGLLDRLKEAGVEEFFAVQAALLPELLDLPLVPRHNAVLNDYLVSAPTGSGKTLAYAVPLVKILQQRIVTRLRALIILPTRDLVMQVRETLELLAKGTGLKIGTATGQSSLAQEQAALVKDLNTVCLGGSSKVDILIATPGRLMDHLHATPNFSLQHLRFLVIDEADRLLTQSFQDWLAQVLTYLRPPANPPSTEGADVSGIANHWYDDLGLGPGRWEGVEPLQSPCQKLLFSATLTRDPSKIAALHLRHPKYFIVQSAAGGAAEDGEKMALLSSQEFALPSSLTEKMVILPADVKPINLLHLLHTASFGIESALIFTKSVDSSNRVLRLIEFFEDAWVAGGGGKAKVAKGYSGELTGSERRKLLADFNAGAIDILVCSDLIARGIDLPSVSHVISYDAPIDMRKYVHRVGRTARAGRDGVAWTLVEKQEARHFKEMLTTANHLKKIKKVKIKEADLEPLQESYKIAISRLKQYYEKA